MRMYQEAWNKLKRLQKDSSKPLEIVAHKKLHPRIYKAILKEKNMDLIFKLLLAENCQSAVLSKISVGTRLVITLHTSLGLDDL